MFKDKFNHADEPVGSSIIGLSSSRSSMFPLFYYSSSSESLKSKFNQKILCMLF